MASETTITKPAWFSIKEAAEYLQIGEQTIYRWMRDGRITYRKIGDSTRFLQDDLDATVQVFPSKKEATQIKEYCPVCHHDELIEGTIRSTGRIYFQPKRTKFWTLKDSNVPVSARMCTRCGTLVQIGDVEKLHQLRNEAESDPEQ
jgi:excisionase family DNA binding protein